MSDEKFAAIHIGVHKTGTSVLQRYLDNHGDVLPRHRVELLDRSELSEFLRWGVGLVEDPAPLRARIEQIRRRADRLGFFASYENTVGRPFPKGGDGRLYPNAPRNVVALAQAIQPCRPMIFLSIRPQHEFVESYYLQTVHQGGQATFRQWLNRVDLAALSWRPVVDALVATVGVEGFEVVDFRLIRQGQEVYIRHFLTQIVPAFEEDVVFPTPYNRSISERGLRIALAVNPLLRSDEYAAMRKFLQRNFSNVDQPRPVLFTEEEKHELDERYRDEYEELIRIYGRSAPGPTAPTKTEERATAG